MNTPLKNCKYFGALTFTVFINNHLSLSNSSSKDDDEINNNTVLLEKLIHDLQLHLYNLIQTDLNQNLFIIRKLLSNLSQIFISNYKHYQNPIDTLLKVILSLDGLDNEHDIERTISFLPEDHVNLILVFYTILIEDISKNLDSNDSLIHSFIYDSIFEKFNSILSYLNHLILASNQKLPSSIHSLTLSTINSWVSYISIAEQVSSVRYSHQDVQNIIQFIFIPFLNPSFASLPIEEVDFDLSNQSISVLTEILEINPSMLNNDSKNFLKSLFFENNHWGVHFLDIVVFNNDNREIYQDEVSNFINLIIIFVQLDILRFSKNLLEGDSQHILSILIKLTDIPGIPIIEESISELLLGFWEELASIFADDEETFKTYFEQLDNQSYVENFNLEIAKIFNQVCSIYWLKIHLIPFEVLKNSKSEFLNYRHNVADFFILIYSLLKLPFYENLCLDVTNNLLLAGSNPEKLINIEATLYLLFKINEDCTFYESQSKNVLPFTKIIFENNLLNIYNMLPIEVGLNQYHYSTLINYLSSCQFFLKTEIGKNYLGDIFDLLFSIILKTLNNDALSSLSLITSKTILKICQECRTNLVSFLPNLEVILIEILKNQQLDHLIRQRLFNSYASIAQCLKDPNEFGLILSRILELINQTSLQMLGSPDSLNEDQEDYLISILSCVLEIGKGCQLPDEPEDLYSQSEQLAINDYWLNDNLHIKNVVVSIIEQYSLNHSQFSQNSTVTERCCLILKTGLGEPLNGPFTFDNDTIFQYLITKMNQLTNVDSIPHIYSLIETVIIINFKDLDDSLINNLIEKVFTNHLQLLKSDPDLIKCSIDLFSTILERKPSLILMSPIFNEIVLAFAIEGLNAKETFIIKSVLKFWVNLISLKKGKLPDHEKINDLFQTNEIFTEFFLKNLLKSFLTTSRSNLDSYYPIFRQLIGKFPLVLKKKLIYILANDHEIINRDKISEKSLETFINQLMVTRGQRSANEVLKKFWLAVNGLIEFNQQSF